MPRDTNDFIIEEVAPARPVLDVVPGEIDRLATAAEAALRDSGLPIFQRGGSIVVPVWHDVPAARGKLTRAAGLKELGSASMIDHLAKAMNFQHFSVRAKKMVPCNPPALLATVILSRSGQWTLPVIAGVITTPTLRPDGSLLVAAGYDVATRLYHVPDPTLILPAMPLCPSRMDARAGLGLLESLLSEFSFADEAIDKAVALSGLMSAVLRGMLPVVPLHAIRASTAGSGKSFLVDIASAISTGRPCPVLAAGDRDEETEKRLVGMLLGAYPIVSVDNVNGEIGGDLLCQAIERPLIRVRALGNSDIAEIESRATFFATGNGLRVRGDMTRRTIICTLDANMERPELREFKQDPLNRILADRGTFVAAVLTIVRAYLAANSPNPPRPIASFADWSNAVRGALVWLGKADPVATMETAREDDPELGELRQLIGAWHHQFGDMPCAVRTVVDQAFRQESDYDNNSAQLNPALRDALTLVAGERGGVNHRRLGQWLIKREGRIVRVNNANGSTTELRFKRAGEIGGVVIWKVV